MLSSPELEASLGMERGLSHVGLTVLTGKSCSYIGRGEGGGGGGGWGGEEENPD